MKKSLILLSVAVALLTLSCKKGTVTGRVLDPFTGKPITHSTVWIKQTPFKISSVDGTFNFPEVKVGKYVISAGKNKHSETNVEIEITEQDLNKTLDLYLYSKEGLNPGLFIANPEGAQKVLNQWVNWEVICSDQSFAYKPFYADAKQKKNLDLPDPMDFGNTIKTLYYQQSSVTRPIEATTYPLSFDKIKNHSTCTNFEKKQTTALFPDLAKGKKLNVSYKSDNMYEIEGTLLSGKQALVLSQDGKMLKAYYLNVK